MSGETSSFSAEWLSLREPADAHARNEMVTAAAAAWATARAGRDGVARTALGVVDLGAGTGSTLRFLAPRLPRPQDWLLVDHDPALLAAVERPCSVVKADGSVVVRTRVDDVSDTRVLAELLQGVDLVTVSALLDLVSRHWADALVHALRNEQAAFLGVLTWDGRISWSPPDRDDDWITGQVRRHQRRDKGFGRALGPDALASLCPMLRSAGATVMTGASDWSLGSDAAVMTHRLIREWAGAAAEVAPGETARIAAWAGRRERMARRGCSRLRVGHRDVFASWPVGPTA